MATKWVAVTEALVSDAMPSDLAPLYATWLSTYPAKAGTLARIVGDTVAQVRTAIRTNPANTLDDDETKIPQDLRPACYDLITHRLAMEMGIDLESSANQVRQDADQLLRMVAYKHWIVESEDNTRSPIYNPPTTGQSTRTALPALIALALCLFPGPARAAWVNGTTVSDANVLMTYIPTNYTPGAGTLVGHAGGIDAKLKTLSGTSAVAEAYSAATAAVAQAAAAYSAATAVVASAGALTNGGATIDGNVLSNGAVIVTSSGGSLSTNGGALAGPIVSTARISITNAGSGTGFYVHGSTAGQFSYLGGLSIGPSLTLYRSATANVVLALAPNAGAYGKLARYNGSGTYYDLVDSETFTPSAYISTTNYQAAITNFLRFLSTAAAPTNYAATGSRGEVRKDSTNLYIHDGTSWGRFPGNWGPW